MSDNKKLLVVIDPGHTGNTYNAGAVKGYYESKAVYDLSLYEKTALEKRGIDVILTRERNQDPGLYERGQMAVKKGNGYANVLFESNHTDAFNGKACGVTVVRSAHLPGSEKLAAKGEIDNVVVLGPPRGAVQVEMSLTDARILGITIPVNLSGDLKGAADVILVGPKGIYNAVGSVIASKAHIHMTPEDARLYGVEDGDSVAVRLETERPVTIDDVIIRVSEKFSLAMHMDYDEANACSYKKGDMGYIIKKN